MKLNNALRQVATTLKTYIDKVVPKKLSDLEIDMEIGSSGVSSWNDLEDKPFGEEMEYTSRTFIPEIEVQYDEYGTLNPINDNWFNYTFDTEGYYLVKINGKNYTILESISSDDKWLYNYGIAYHMGNDYLYNQNEENNGEHIFFGSCYTESSGIGGVVVEIDDTLASLGIFTLEVIPLESYEFKQLDEKYIPSTIARDDEILTKTNTVEYTPTSDYNPATKLYVDSIIPSEMDALALVTEVGFVNPVANNGNIFTDAEGNIYTF